MLSFYGKTRALVTPLDKADRSLVPRVPEGGHDWFRPRVQMCPICGVPGSGWHSVLLPQGRRRHLLRTTKALRDNPWKPIMMHSVLPPEVCWNRHKAEKAWVDRVYAIVPKVLAMVGRELPARPSLPSQSVCLDMSRLMADLAPDALCRRPRYGNRIHALQFLDF